MLKTILVAITNDSKSEAVLNQAIGMAKRYQADLVLTHVNQIVLPQTGTLAYSHGNSITIDSLSADEMKKFENRAVQAGIKHVETRIIEGLDVASIITGELSRQYQPDLIILGDHKHHSFLEKMIGSTASGVVRNAECAVYIVK